MDQRAPRYRLSCVFRPGLKLSRPALEGLRDELRAVASTCLDPLPDYQCIGEDLTELDHCVIAFARDEDGVLAGFCSTRILAVPTVGSVLHLGLTCVHRDHRAAGLTHSLTSHLLSRYLLRRPWGRVWFSNVACVLSSLGNVALHMDRVYPSPYWQGEPRPEHLAIAASIDRHHRRAIAIDADARFDWGSFVFRDSVPDSPFLKAGDDTRYHHRKAFLNRYYGTRMRWSRGDEILQVGTVSLASLAKYLLRSLRLWPAPTLVEIEPSPARGELDRPSPRRAA